MGLAGGDVAGVLTSRSSGPIGPTRIGELLLVDVRSARRVPPDSRLAEVCRRLFRTGACEIVEATLVIDILEVPVGDRGLVADPSSWPGP